MISLFVRQSHPPYKQRDVATARACLRCKAVFQSEGFGERICPRCKGSSVWKSAPPMRGDGTRQR
jgi:uncharacterized paraquat-inducible protein A